jgi:hypothetical protein
MHISITGCGPALCQGIFVLKIFFVIDLQAHEVLAVIGG